MKTAIFKIMTLLLIMSLSLSAEILLQQGFEGTESNPWGYTTSGPETFWTDKSPWCIWGPDNHLTNLKLPDNLKPLPDNGNYLWNAENTDNLPDNDNNDPCILTFNTIDLSSYSGDLSLNFFYFTFYYNDVTKSWSGANDILNYYVEYDNGTNWDTPIALNMDTDEWTKITINIPESSTHVRLRFEVKNNTYAEIGAFDLITLETTDGATPITLSDFSAKALSSGIELSWTTGSESENSGFKLYRDNEVIAFIEGAGTTTETNDYSYLDKNVIPGKTYTYTLADLSYDNTEEIHENKTITVTAAKNLVDNVSFTLDAAYPNPFNPSTSIDYSLTETQNIELSIFNMKGERVITLFDGERTAGQYSQTWNASHVQSGVYLLRARYGNQITTQKLLLLK